MLTHPVVAKTVEWTQKVLPDAQKIFPDLDPRKLKLDQMFLKLTSTAGKALLKVHKPEEEAIPGFDPLDLDL